MYTGVIEHTGTVDSVTERSAGCRVRVSHDFPNLDRGESVAVDGVCLTAERTGDGWFAADLSAETVARTRFTDAAASVNRVNLERPLAAGERFHGHFMKGTVDATTEVTAVEADGDGWRYEFAIPPGHGRYVVEKGAVAVDGVSLTVADRDRERFAVAVVPTTYELTTLSRKQRGDPVHVEWDVLAKYAQAGERPAEDGGPVGLGG